MTPQSPLGVLLAQGAVVKLKQNLQVPVGYWQMVWEVRQSTAGCGCVPLACPACFALCAGSITPVGGSEPIRVAQSADPPSGYHVPPRPQGLGESWTYDPGLATDLFETWFLRKGFLSGH